MGNKKKKRDISSDESSDSSSGSSSSSSSSSSEEEEKKRRRRKKDKKASRRKNSSKEKDATTERVDKEEEEAVKPEVVEKVTSTEVASPPKPNGKVGKTGRRRNYRTKRTALEDDEDNDTVSKGLKEAKMMQKARRRGPGVNWTNDEEEEERNEVSGSTELQSVVHGSAEGGLVLNAVSEAFRTEVNEVGVVTAEKEKYVQEKIAQIRMGDEQFAKRAAAEEDLKTGKKRTLEEQLYDVPEFLKQEKEEIEEAGDRWLTGITEVPLPIAVKLDNIERTELAKATMLQGRKSKGKANKIVPKGVGNLTANYKHHNSEWIKNKRDESSRYRDAKAKREGVDLPVAPKQKGKGKAGGNSQSAVPYASDDKVVDRFVKRFKYKNY